MGLRWDYRFRSVALRSAALWRAQELVNDYADGIFASIDRNGDGSINVRELLLCLRKDPAVAKFMNLPMHTKQEGGTRETFERKFQAIDKVRRIPSSTRSQELSRQLTQSCGLSTLPTGLTINSISTPTAYAR